MPELEKLDGGQPAELPPWYLRLGAEMQAYWPNLDITKETLVAWWVDLHDIHPSRVRGAYDAIRRENPRWPPNGGEVAQRARQLAETQATLARGRRNRETQRQLEAAVAEERQQLEGEEKAV